MCKIGTLTHTRMRISPRASWRIIGVCRYFTHLVNRVDYRHAIRNRHARATLALPAGVNPKVGRERLGHSTIAVTMDTYSHVSPGMKEEAAVAVEKLL